MLVNFLADAWRRLTGKAASGRRERFDAQPVLEKGYELWSAGDVRAAMLVYQDALEHDPRNVEFLTNLGVCLASIGDEAGASELFERAYTLDDSYLPGVLNHARLLVDKRKSVEAMPFLRHVWCCNPSIGTLNAIYSTLCLNLGDADGAVYFQRKGWLADFDVLRSANGNLFKSTYADIDEKRLAAEHVFWAETQRDLGILEGDFAPEDVPVASRRVRVGYWSPDLRNHSVRYFFRPLVENHDKSNYEVFVYHDNHAEDNQTDLIRRASEHFYNVYSLNDQELYDLIRSHRLDVLVELAGHTSANRLPMLQNRMATLQVTGLGYPPTTGLASIDLKVLDRYVVTPDFASYYAEEPMVLPHSFWCFDPMEEALIEPVPPVERNGYVTYACVGNLAKINMRMVACWRQILEGVDSARLVLRSISFEDSAAFDAVKRLLSAGGVPLDRVDLLLPAGGKDFFQSYADVDVILDTYPFNGGTTTCFGTYMGVPVVSLYGESLTSRMGLSILSNLGVPHLAVDSEVDYVERAISVGRDVAFLRDFRATVRGRFQSCSLGSGHMYARDFEAACKEALTRCESQRLSYQHQVVPLPEDEVIRRAYRVLASGNLDAAQRVLGYCFRYYPNSAQTHLLGAQIKVVQGEVNGAIDAIKGIFGGFGQRDRVAALISLTHWSLQLSKLDDARSYSTQLHGIEINDDFDRMQGKLFDIAFSQDAQLDEGALEGRGLDVVSVAVLIPSNDIDRFEEIRVGMMTRCDLPAGWSLRFVRCSEGSRHRTYAEALNWCDDVLLILQPNVEIYAADFLQQVWSALKVADVVGFAGALRWTQLDWRQDDFRYKVGGFSVTTKHFDYAHEIKFLGRDRVRLVKGVAVLDGSMLAIKPKSVRNVAFDDELLGAECLLEEEWTFRVAGQGGRLAVHRSLGVILLPQQSSDAKLRGPARMHWLEKYHVDPFVPQTEDDMYVSVLVSDAVQACNIMRAFACD